MNDKDALMAAILTDPHDDLPRLVFADYLDDHGDGERSAFIRVQVELSRLGPCPDRFMHGDPLFCSACAKCGHRDELRRRERKLHPQGSIEDVRFADMLGIDVGRAGSPAIRWEYHRGFIRSVRLDWADWLRHHEALFWNPRQSVECPACHNTGWVNNYCCYICGKPEDQGTRKMGTGRTPRPYVPTAQPITSVKLTDMPPALAESNLRHYSPVVEVDSLGPEGRMKWTRVKCETCDGTGWDKPVLRYIYGEEASSQSRCPSCHGTPSNRWTCDAWPGAEFEMPTADRT